MEELNPLFEQDATRLREQLRAAGVAPAALLAEMRAAAKAEADAAYARADAAKQEVLQLATHGGPGADVAEPVAAAAAAGRAWRRAVTFMGWLDRRLAQEAAVDALDAQFAAPSP